MRRRGLPAFIALCLIGIMLTAGIAAPGGPGAEIAEQKRLVDGVQAYYIKIDSFRARFVQVSEIRALGREERGEGVLYYKKPGRMRWEYRGKEEQTFFIDDDTVWMYFPKERQAYRQKMSEAFRSKTPAAFISGAGKLRQTFRISLEPVEPGRALRVLRLEPLKGEEGIGNLWIGVDPKTFQVRETRSRDLLGNLTRIEYHDIEAGVEMTDDFFIFQPPEGVVVSDPPGLKW